MENDIRRNGSGYVDPTAHKAIKNMMREEHKREVNSEQRFNDFLTAIFAICDYNSKDIKVIIKEIEKG